jgi:uncharacterized RDD family membrane protein YckC
MVDFAVYGVLLVALLLCLPTVSITREIAPLLASSGLVLYRVTGNARGQTLGKRLSRIAVARDDGSGSPPGLGRSVARESPFIAMTILSSGVAALSAVDDQDWAIYASLIGATVSLLWIAADLSEALRTSGRAALHDRLGHTSVDIHWQLSGTS